MIGVLLEGEPGDGSFIDAAVEASRALSAAGMKVDVCWPPPIEPKPEWQAVLAHGSSLLEWVKERPEYDRVIVLTDLPDEIPDNNNLHFVDWAWSEAAYCVGRVAGTYPRDETPIVLMTGPLYPPQVRFINGFLRGVLKSGHVASKLICHTRNFHDAQAAEILLRQAANSLNGGRYFFVTSAGPAGEHCARLARDNGCKTAGFGGKGSEHLVRIHSDVYGSVLNLLFKLSNNEDIAAVTRFGVSSGFLNITLDSVASTTDATLLKQALSEIP